MLYKDTTIAALIKSGDIKVGDTVQTSQDVSCSWHLGNKILEIGVLSGDSTYKIHLTNGTKETDCNCTPAQLAHCDITVNGNSSKSLTPNRMADLKEKFALIFTSEPKKSFRKAGITDGDNFLTDDGKSVFLAWLLDKLGDDFKKEVCEELLKKEEKE